MKKNYVQMTYKERVKTYLVATIIILIVMFLMPVEYPSWTIILNLVILLITILYNFYKWKVKANTKSTSIIIYNNIMGIIICYFIFILPYNPSTQMNIIYFTLLIPVGIFEYYRELKKQE